MLVSLSMGVVLPLQCVCGVIAKSCCESAANKVVSEGSPARCSPRRFALSLIECFISRPVRYGTVHMIRAHVNNLREEPSAQMVSSSSFMAFFLDRQSPSLWCAVWNECPRHRYGRSADLFGYLGTNETSVRAMARGNARFRSVRRVLPRLPAI